MHTSRCVMAAAALAVGLASTLVAQTAPAVRTGSVSGMVVDKDGKPASGVAIAYTLPPASAPAPGSARAGPRVGRPIQAGTTDDKGAFTIKDAPVGDIRITVALVNPTDNSQQHGSATVSVMEAQETKLAAPIKMIAGQRRGGGVGAGGTP